MIIAVIPAKKSSNRLEGKNTLKINGMTLIEHAVKYGKNSSIIARIFVSTDSKEIAEHAKNCGAEVIMRDKTLGGETPLLDVYKHAYNQIADASITHIIGIQPDHPGRQTSLDNTIKYVKEKNIDDLFTVDRFGMRNGSLRILSTNALKAVPSVYASAIRDDCVNIHNISDFNKAKVELEASGQTIIIDGKRISNNDPVFIIAEAACNHMCDINLAKRMIDEAAYAGADSIKFQTYKAEKLVTKNAVAFWGNDNISQLDYYRRLDRFGKEQYAELFNYSRKKNIVCFSSPFDYHSADMLNELGTPVFKIASCEIPNLHFIKYVAEYGKPVILSTGASYPEEIHRAVDTILETGNTKLILMACTLSYPTKQTDANINRIRTLKELYPEIIIGLSDHTEPEENMVIPSIAVGLGARVIEKHYTINRTMTGSGHFFAVDPASLKKMVINIRIAEKILGNGKLGVEESEKKALNSARRSIVAEMPITKGQIIEAHMLGTKRPFDGLDASMLDQVIGRKALKNIQPDEKITFEMLE